ncbi:MULTISPECIES: pyridoxamine 5'-phosphate oxidase family protein [Halobacterium]|uniref:FMN-binding domain protein n=4 Tax=Halobacterium salinarum TaxID=2242 RepID=Q9HPI5_HALSA|nr:MULTISPECIES: pyridoxamine 5'-phosphate oxidase family protein [Halobacterium]AAG19882.1 hypothetical protein VNG_1621H [Halobacterium salinarum NRC-1]MBB6088889.1 hypothetical protein [Halobacterium salinarum]MDL0121059.1 pyridoxamine 5'-phosphate oxidase family protein [Halobacterium salinarum]MDL0131336.1 pyridoxamine 5'-phosphate oxidase family protein [Halobacterium salinarum]MDL0136251.1 pyridoxamine 5'-phosphate oxidase family protein [Halobacterium salinarum]
MTDTTAVHLEPDDRDAFLAPGGTGVLSFGREDAGPPHSLPVSYGYDPDTESFFFRLSYGDDTDKPDPETTPLDVSFVVHDEADHGWCSVVAHGRLQPTDADAISTTALSALRRVDIPLLDTFDRPLVETEFLFFRLHPDAITARADAPPTT